MSYRRRYGAWRRPLRLLWRLAPACRLFHRGGRLNQRLSKERGKRFGQLVEERRPRDRHSHAGNTEPRAMNFWTSQMPRPNAAALEQTGARPRSVLVQIDAREIAPAKLQQVDPKLVCDLVDRAFELRKTRARTSSRSISVAALTSQQPRGPSCARPSPPTPFRVLVPAATAGPLIVPTFWGGRVFRRPP